MTSCLYIAPVHGTLKWKHF